jgi:hypothetical protein
LFLFLGREEQISELKKFGTDFKLAESLEKSKKTSSEESTTNTKIVENLSEQQQQPATQQPSKIVPQAITPTEIEKNSTYSKSKLNPYAKEFVYNPNAKPFTPVS